jgi:hypothetical protein
MSMYYGSSPSSTHSRGGSGTSSNYSRPSSVSPQFANAYPVFATLSTRQRFNLSRGFEAEDDYEFCPALAARSNHHPKPDTVAEADYGSKSPSDSPGQTHDVLVASPGTIGHRTRKVIEIIDPTTGLKVGGALGKR